VAVVLRGNHLIVLRRIALTLSVLCTLAPSAWAVEKAVIFPFALIDQQQQFELGLMPKGIDPEEKRRLEIITAELTKLIKESGRYEVVDSAPIAAEIEEKSPMHKCNGCEDDLAKKVGADVAFIGTVRKVSDVLFTVSVFVRDVGKEQVVKRGSSEIYGNTDAMWLRALHYVVDRRLFKENAAQKGAAQ
jgi:Protein of unknown function (DUF2380)